MYVRAWVYVVRIYALLSRIIHVIDYSQGAEIHVVLQVVAQSSPSL